MYSGTNDSELAAFIDYAQVCSATIDPPLGPVAPPLWPHPSSVVGIPEWLSGTDRHLRRAVLWGEHIRWLYSKQMHMMCCTLGQCIRLLGHRCCWPLIGVAGPSLLPGGTQLHRGRHRPATPGLHATGSSPGLGGPGVPLQGRGLGGQGAGRAMLTCRGLGSRCDAVPAPDSP